MAINLDDEVKAALAGARDANKPMTLAYTGQDGAPHLSFRGGVVVFGPDQLAIWVRKRDGGFANAIAQNPAVALLYGDFDGHRIYSFIGKARVDETANDAVWDATPQIEKDRDPERNGIAVLVDLDSVTGRGTEGPVAMTRD